MLTGCIEELSFVVGCTLAINDDDDDELGGFSTGDDVIKYVGISVVELPILV